MSLHEYTPPVVEDEFVTCYDNNSKQHVTIECKTHKEAFERAAVCVETRSWVRTPYHHMGRVKHSGVDCATILAEVYPNAGVVSEKVDISFYPLDWNLHRSTEQYLGYIFKYMREIPFEEAKIGDVVLFKWGRCYAHGAIIIDPGWPHVIHADITIGMVVFSMADEGRLGEADREKRFFTPW